MGGLGDDPPRILTKLRPAISSTAAGSSCRTNKTDRPQISNVTIPKNVSRPPPATSRPAGRGRGGYDGANSCAQEPVGEEANDRRTGPNVIGER
jgi:hypothetical protein